MIEIKINNIGDLRRLNLSELSYSIFNSISIDPEYAIMCAWHLLHKNKISDRIYSKIINKAWSGKLKQFAKIPKKYCENLFYCYNQSKQLNNQMSLLPN